MEIMTILETLNRCHSPSGEERAISERILEYAAPFADDCRTDAMGNLIVHKKGTGPRVMVAAHMDSVGLVVTHVDEKGFLRFGTVGGLDAFDLPHIQVRFRSGLQGVVGLDEKREDKDKVSVKNMYIDIGAADRADALRYVKPGDTAVFLGRQFTIGDKIVAPYLDNHVSCAVLLDVLSKMKPGGNDAYFVFTAQEEVGLRGAGPAAYAVEPEYCLVVDVTDCCDTPNSENGGTGRLGGGAAVKVMDHAAICHPQMVQALLALAAENRIPCQRDVMLSGGTDAGAIHTSRAGVRTGGISIPCRYVHTPAEMVSQSDVKACADLLLAYVESDLTQENKTV